MVMDRTPDSSHLTDNKKRIVEAVIHRQKVEDTDETHSDEHDYSSPSIAISSRSYSQLNDSGVVCQVCQKTKFVNEQSSRQCSICQKRFCVRCGIRLKSQTYICNQCRQKQEQYFSPSKNICKQYVSDYILSQTHDEKLFDTNQKRILPKLNSIDDDSSAITTGDKKKRLLPEIKQNILRDFQYHSLEERDLPPESTLKDSGIDTASSSTILNVISPEKFQKPMTYWRFNDNRTEQTGYIYLKNNLEQGKGNIFNALGLQIQGGEIIDVIPGSVADTYGQLKIGDQILEWNGEKLSNNNANDLNRISMQSSQIHLIVKRILSQSVQKNPIQLQISFQYDQKHLYIMIYGARNIPIQQGLLACQLSLQYERDTLEKCTKAQPCSSGICTWNQRIIFFDLNNLDHLNLSIKLINLEVNQEVVGEILFQKLNLNNKSEWYNLTDSLFNRGISSMTDTSSTTNNRKRQLPDIPAEQLHANRERVSQDLYQKATELKLRLHMQSTTGKTLLTQRSFDQTQMKDGYHNTPRKSMVNLSTTSTKNASLGNLKDKIKIPMIRDKSAPGSVTTRRPTVTGQNEISLGKAKLKSLEEKYRKTIKKRHSLETPDDEIDSDGFDFPSISNMNSTEMLTERSRTHRNRSLEHFTQIQLNEEELRQMEMRSYDTIPAAIKKPPIEPESKPSPSPVISNEKINQRNDGTQSDSGLSTQSEPNSKRRTSKQSKAFVILGLSKKANSSANLGHGRRCGFQRSEEVGVQPHLRNRALERQTSKENEQPTSAPPMNSSSSPFNPSLQRDQYHSMPTDMKLWSGALKLPHEHQFTDFIEGLGRGQLVGRQVLASPCHGEIQIGLRDQHGLLEVEIVRARNLAQKVVYKMPPAPYVKVYLLDGKTCLEKQRTRTTRRTLDPLIQQTLNFKEYFRGKVLQISVWGDYGKLDRKVFMGVCQLGLDEVNLSSSQQVLDWYKLFSANSLLNNYTIVQQSPRRIHSTSTINRS